MNEKDTEFCLSHDNRGEISRAYIRGIGTWNLWSSKVSRHLYIRSKYISSPWNTIKMAQKHQNWQLYPYILSYMPLAWCMGRPILWISLLKEKQGKFLRVVWVSKVSEAEIKLDSTNLN